MDSGALAINLFDSASDDEALSRGLAELDSKLSAWSAAMRDAQAALEELPAEDEPIESAEEPIEEAVAFAPEPEPVSFESEPSESTYDPALVPKFDPNFDDAFDEPAAAPAPQGKQATDDPWAPMDLESGAEVVSDWPTDSPKQPSKQDDGWPSSSQPAQARPAPAPPTPRPQRKPQPQVDQEKLEQEREREQILLSTLHPEMASRARRLRRMNPEIAIDDVIARLKEQAEQEQRESGDDKRSSWWRRK